MSHFPGNLWKWQWPLVKCSWNSISHYFFTSVLLTSSLIGAITYLYTTSRRSSRNALRTLANSRGHCVPAMFNLGNTCFANSLLQGLASSKAFFKWIQRIDTSLAYGGHKLVFLDALKRVVQELNDATKTTCSASDVIDALLAHRWSIPPNTEQDLYELFNVFVTTWDEELAELRYSRASPLQKIIEIEQENKMSLNSPIIDKEILRSNVNITRRNVGDVEDKKIHDSNYLNNTSLNSSSDFHPLPLNSLSFEHVKSTVADEKLLKPPCMGLLAIQLRCCKEDCLYKKIREEKFCVLSLSLPKSPTPLLTFSRLLERYFATEYIQGASCDRCLERKQDRSGGLMRKQGFCKLPSLLIFRIERVGFSPDGYIFKRTERFLFPEFIDVREYCFFSEQSNPKQTKDSLSNSSFRVLGGSALNASSSIPKVEQQWQQATQLSLVSNGTNLSEYDSMFKYKYQLRAVSVHIGQAQSGHFITYRRGIGVQNRSTWYKTSDTEVTPVSFAQVVSSEAYMLFYDRALATLN
ncbi:Ubiquitin carboxyl-terminal hydrolase family protein [Brugia malayi]|uniref:ubiquitinyl hydrolase 1 n=2 Tax=Brugia malayi TaxID=6279 RepID=A0A0K0K087_BRUMA|nr:Ubiquitin carboxyl-terminal hydrolase family protein [Brugia malayi]CRZ24089.1 Bm9719 [Brugia malayi]VIO92120.1 Ubiquitin carboxyl-terminal hydrolase family protein [Brugia malayi]